MATIPSGEPQVSIIVPTYNYGRYIGETLESLRSQTLDDWECIAVDDGSTDDTRAALAGYAAGDARIRYVWQTNAKQAAARNNGLRQARGKYIQFLDADDLLEREKLARQVDFLEAHPEVDVVYANVRYFDFDRPGSRRLGNDSDDPWMPLVSGAGSEILLPLVRNNIMPGNSPLLRSTTVRQVGFFSEALTPVEDWEYLIRCAAAGKRFHYDDAEGRRALVRAHPESASSDHRRMYRAEIRMRETIQPLLQNSDACRLNETRLAEITGLLGVEEHQCGARRRALSYFLKAARMDRRRPFRAKWLLCAAAALFVTRAQMNRLVKSSVRKRVMGSVSGA
jgi:glycosyltransferase involved in cell wall biosynthesis